MPSKVTSTKGSIISGTQYDYYGLGQLMSVKKLDESDCVSYEYKYNNLISKVTENGKSMTYDYDAKNRLSTVTDYYSNVTTYGYNDPLSRLKTITQNGETVTYEYNQKNELISEQYGASNLITYDYDELGNMKSLQNGYYNNPNSYINRYDYVYDNNSNRRFETETIFGSAPIQKEYVYDDINRLKKEIYPDGSSTEYTFDKNGNIVLKEMQHSIGYNYNFKLNDADRKLSNISLHSTLYAYDANNRMINATEVVQGVGTTYSGRIEAVTDFDYDRNGNMTKKELGGQVDENMVEYVYNICNQLTAVKENGQVKGAYTYYADGMRKSKTVGSLTTDFFYRDGIVVNESRGGHNSATNYIGLTGIYGRKASNMAVGTTKYLKNGHGDVVSLIENGVVNPRYDYDAYGNQKTLEANGDDKNPYRYCGEYYDDESGLIYLRARYYEPSMSRFINEDPIRDGLNWYAYCGNNPINRIDPWGLASFMVNIIAGIGTDTPETAYSRDNWESYNGFFKSLMDEIWNELTAEGHTVVFDVIYPYGAGWGDGGAVDQVVKVRLEMGRSNEAGEFVAATIISNYNDEDNVIIIGHSGGGTAGYKAMEILSDKGFWVAQTVMIGSPRQQIRQDIAPRVAYYKGSDDVVSNYLGNWGTFGPWGTKKPGKYHSDSNHSIITGYGGHMDYFRSPNLSKLMAKLYPWILGNP